MKFRALSIGIAVLLMLIGIPLAMFVTAKVLPANPPARKMEAQAAGYKISGPYTQGNLTIFLIHGQDTMGGQKFLTLSEALDRKVVVVHETKDVNELAIENVSSVDEVYVQSGDIVKGGQQDRVLAVDLIVPPRSGKIPIAAFCVEHGRWQKRGSEAAGKFESSNDRIASRDLKIATNATKSQGEVWDKVSETQAKLSVNAEVTVTSNASASSLQLSLENKKVKEMTGNYVKKLSGIIDGKSDVIGYAFAINGKINSADVYGSSVLFRKLWPKLLKASAVEAIAELQKGAKFEEATAESVRTFFDEAEKGKASDNEVTARVRMVTRETDKNVLFETRDEKQKDAWLHRSYVMKQ
ncbi:MAG TPA: DUF6569 family protein [Pyrinomonadaceae bacterium]|jgi:hypothetical protein|nr:DUF6569 family protein [Pyrinomonadaceae bacterium]